MALIGLVIASLDNLFLSTEPFQFAISVAGVVIFADLTAWDTQRIKNAFFIRLDDVDRRKIAIIGALTLYLDFLHLFLMSLRFVGRRRE